MKIAGLNKLTLLDFPERMACIVFTAGCNLACPFCHNSDIICADVPLVDCAEFFAFLEKRKGVLEGVCISGGEPLLQADIAGFMRQIKGFGLEIKLDTNGLFPDKLAELLNEKLVDYVAMDVKNSKEKYAVTAGLPTDKSDELYGAVLRSARIIMDSGVDYEFRTTVVKGLHSPADMQQIGSDFSGAKRFFLQRFVDSGRILGEGLDAPDEAEMDELLSALQKYIAHAQVR